MCSASLHGIDRELDVHVAFDLAAAGLVDELLGGLGDDAVAVVVEPIDQRPDRRIFLILDHGGVIEGAHQVAAGLEFAQQPLVVDVEAERFGGGVEVGAVDEQSDFFHVVLSCPVSVETCVDPTRRTRAAMPPWNATRIVWCRRTRRAAKDGTRATTTNRLGISSGAVAVSAVA